MPDPLSGLHLISGPLPIAATALGAGALLYLLVQSGRRWPLRAAAAFLAAAAGVPLINWLLISGLTISAADLPAPVQVIIGMVLLGLILAILGLRSGPRRRRILSPIAFLAVSLMAILQANIYYGAFPLAGSLVGDETRGVAPLPDSLRAGNGPESHVVAGGQTVAAAWTSPSGLPSEGQVFATQIPGGSSGFTGRSSYVYLPPAYFASPRPRLPVLILMTGQPGTPSQWLAAGHIKEQMDRFASDHGGLAPVVVMPEVNGDAKTNLMCMDSALGHSGTFISKDLPSWIKSTLTVDPNPRHWILGGFSWGGTCTSQMTALHPDVYPNGMIFHGELEPRLTNDRDDTVQRTFAGDTSAFNAQTPLSALNAAPHPDTWLYYSAGATDSEFTSHMNVLAEAARRSGAQVVVRPTQNAGHSWEVVLNNLRVALDWFAPRVGLTR